MQQAVLAFDSMLAYVLSQVTPDIRCTESLHLPLPACMSKVSMRSDYSANVLRATSNVENPGPSSSTENSSQNMFIGTDKISEIMNDLDSDGGSLSELLTTTVQSKFTLQQQQQHWQ